MKKGTCKDRKNAPNPDWAQIRAFLVDLFTILGTFAHFSVGLAAQENEQMGQLYREYMEVPTMQLYQRGLDFLNDEKLDEALICSTISYFKRAMQVAEQPICQSYDNIAGVYLYYNDNDNAKHYLQQAFDISLEQKNWPALSKTLLNIMLLNWRTDSVARSMPFIESYLNAPDMVRDSIYDLYTVSLVYIAGIYMQMNDYRQALHHLELAEAGMRQEGSLYLLMQVLQMEVECYEKTGDQQAMHQAKYEYMELKDSINTSEHSRSVIALVCMGALLVVLVVLAVMAVQRRQQLMARIYEQLDDTDFLSQQELTVERLAEAVGIHEKVASPVINEATGKNFNTLLNEYRIREVCKRLTDTAHYGQMTTETIAEGLGYKSRSHFIRTFKKITGLTAFCAWALTTLSVSCVNHYHGELTIAEDMLNDYPDSSLAVIKRLDAHITDKHEKAFSLYIKTCASAKLGIPITWVEEMESAAPFIETRANSRHKALYYYYLGFAEKENHRLPAAVASFLKSLEFQDPTHADLLLQQTFANLHFCYYEQNLQEDALQVLDKLVDISSRLKDTLMLSWACYYQANIYICQNDTEKAKSALKDAVRMASGMDHKTILGYCYHGYTTLSLEQGDISSASHYNDLARNLSPEMQDDLNWIFMRGRIFAAQGVQDSAVHYLTKAMKSSDTERRYWATRYLFNLSKQDSDYAYLGIYADSLLFYHDLFENQNAQAAIKAAIAQHQNELNTRQSHQLQRVWMLIVMIVAAIGLGTFLYIKHKSGNEKNEMRRQLQEMKEQIEEQKNSRLPADDGRLRALVIERLRLSCQMFTKSSAYKEMRSIQLLRRTDLTMAERQKLMEALNLSFSDIVQDFCASSSNISDEDFYFCLLSYIGFNTRTIASVFCISEETARKRKSRIRQKLPEMESLVFFQKK